MNGLLKKAIGTIVFYYPVLYIFATMVSTRLKNYLFFTVIILFLCGHIQSILLKDKYMIKNILVMGGLLVVTVADAMRSTSKHLLNQDYFGYLGVVLIFSLMAQKEYIEEIKLRLTDYFQYKMVIAGFYFFLILSVFTHGGLQFGWGVSIPLLYGPFEYPHTLSYLLLGIYVLSSIELRLTDKKLPVYIMAICVICSMWTAVRSGLIALFIFIFMDFISIKDKNKKIYIIFFLVVILGVLVSFTDILTNNPLMQKTSNAAENGSLTNGRENFIQVLLGYFLMFETTNQRIFGIGIPGIRQIMQSVFAMAIHAHNDAINVLVGYGLVGTAVFWSTLVNFCAKAKWGIIVFAVLFVLLFTNGLFMYTCFTPSMIVLVIYTLTYFGDTEQYREIAQEKLKNHRSILYLGNLGK